jgi:cell division protein FtsQ
MSTFDSTASRFLRPTDVARLRRNQRRIQAQRLLVILRNGSLVLALAGLAFWAVRLTQSDARFAVRAIAVEGAIHTPKKELDAITAQYVGLNLFRIDIDRVQHDLRTLGWVQRIDIEKTLPDTLRIRITERVPMALVRNGETLSYVDAEGTAFAELTPAAGNEDLPIISEASGAELARTVKLLAALGAQDAELYARVSELWPIPPRGFAIFDRQLGAIVYANEEDIVPKWRELYAILAAENNPEIEYADLRFADRVIVRQKDVKQPPGEPRESNIIPPAAAPVPADGRRPHVQN